MVKVKTRRARGASSGRGSSTRSPAPEHRALGAGGRGPREATPAGSASWSSRRAATRRRASAERAFWGDARRSPSPRKAPLAIVYLVDTLRADHTGVYGYSRDTTPELDAFARGRGRLRRGDRARLLDQALGGLDPDLAPARPAPRGAAARPARPVERHARRAARRAGLGHRRRHRQLGDLRRGVGSSTAASTSSPASTARTTAAASSWAPTSWWTPPSPSCARGRACPPSSTCTRWTRTSPTRRPRPSTGCSSPTPPRGTPPATRAPTTRSRSTASG